MLVIIEDENGHIVGEDYTVYFDVLYTVTPHLRRTITAPEEFPQVILERVLILDVLDNLSNSIEINSTETINSIIKKSEEAIISKIQDYESRLADYGIEYRNCGGRPDLL